MSTPTPPQRKPRTPSHCLHRASGQAVVTLNGKDIYLGKHGTAASRAEYDRVIREWLEAGRHLPSSEATVSVVELIAAFMRHKQIVPLGPRAQEILTPLLKLDSDAYLFSPSEAMAAHRAKRRAARKTPTSCGTVAGENVKAKPARRPGDRYSVESYCQRVHTACDKAFPPGIAASRALISLKLPTRPGMIQATPLAKTISMRHSNSLAPPAFSIIR
jgi:hypothetical protein